MSLFLIFISAVLINNYVLYYFLGICPFIGVSKKIGPALSLGLATTFVMSLTASVAWLINRYILIGLNLEFLKIVSFIMPLLFFLLLRDILCY